MSNYIIPRTTDTITERLEWAKERLSDRKKLLADILSGKRPHANLLMTQTDINSAEQEIEYLEQRQRAGDWY